MASVDRSLYSPLKGSATREYVNNSTGEIVSRRAAIEGSTGQRLEAQALHNQLLRETGRIPADSNRQGAYNGLVAKWKAANPNNKVRGNSQSAQDFKRLLQELKAINDNKEMSRKQKSKAKMRLFFDWGLIDDDAYDNSG